METTELGANDEEHAIERLGVFVLRQEVRVETEAQRNFSGSEEVGLENGCIEDAEGSHDHLIVLVGGVGCDELLQLGAVQHLVHLQPQVAQGGQEVIASDTPGLNVMGVGKVEVELVDELGILVGDLHDIIGGEGLRTQSLLDLGQQFGVDAVVRVEER